MIKRQKKIRILQQGVKAGMESRQKELEDCHKWDFKKFIRRRKEKIYSEGQKILLFSLPSTPSHLRKGTCRAQTPCKASHPSGEAVGEEKNKLIYDPPNVGRRFLILCGDHKESL